MIPSPQVSGRRPSNPRWALAGAVATLAAGALALTGCGAPSSAGSNASAGGTVTVVASTNVYGDLVTAIGGDRVSVTSIISKPSQDPHSYEATTQDRLAVSKAKLVVENGGGYDPFVDTLVRDAGHSSVVTAVQAAGTAQGGNEHIWYDFEAMRKVTAAIADRLAELDPAGKDAYTGHAKEVDAKLAGLEGKVTALKAKASGKKAAVTEPVPLYLLEAAGLTNATPEAFTSAIEEGQDVPPAVLKDMLDLIGARGVALLAYNPQTESPQTQQLRKAADAAKVPVVDFTESVPEGTSYLAWMQANVDALGAALT